MSGTAYEADVEFLPDDRSLGLPDQHGTVAPERALWCSVLQQALDDLKLPRESREFKEARQLFVAKDGPWADQRSLICDFADVEEKHLVSCARKTGVRAGQRHAQHAGNVNA